MSNRTDQKIKNNHIRCILKALLSSYALLAVYNEPVSYAEYGRGIIFYIKQSLYEIFDIPNFIFLMASIVMAFFYLKLSENKEKTGIDGSRFLIAFFFSLIIVLGTGYRLSGSLTPCFGSLSCTVKSIIGCAGYTFLIYEVIGSILKGIERLDRLRPEYTAFWKFGMFFKSFIVIMLSYLPFMVLSFPINLCWDAYGQIEQVMLGEYTLHHPIVDTLIMGGIVKAGNSFLGSYDAGLFMYMILQVLIVVSVFAYSLKYLASKNTSVYILRGLLVFYCISPVFSNSVTTALKDVPFSAFSLLFVVMLARCLDQSDADIKKWYVLALTAMFVIFTRKNGLPMVLLSVVGILIYLFVTKKPRALIRKISISGTAAVIVAVIINLLLANVLDAAHGSRGEMLSVPFQQTARYLRYYGDDVTQEEKAVIEKVLTNTETLAEVYDYTIADPVKAYYNLDASASEITAYIEVWIKCFFRHPGVYFDAFFAHVYGWFDPAVDNSIRYDIRYEETLFDHYEVLPDIDRQLNAFYSIEDMITPLSFMQNIGFAVFSLFILVLYQRKSEKDGCFRALNIPLWISLLICMASPVFFGHPRYAFPILFSVPFLYGLTCSDWKAVPGENEADDT